MTTPSIFIACSNTQSEISHFISNTCSKLQGLSVITSAIHSPNSSNILTRPPEHESYIYAERHGLSTEEARLQAWGRLSAWAQTEYTDLLNQANKAYWKHKSVLDMANWQHDTQALSQASAIILEICPSEGKLHSTEHANTHLNYITGLIGYIAGHSNPPPPILCITIDESCVREHTILNGLAASNQLDIITINSWSTPMEDRIHEWLMHKNVHGLRVPKLASDSCPVVLLAGPPGAGKSTLGKSLAQWLHVPHISTGETLRALPPDSELSKQIRQYLETGALVPAHIMLQVVHHRLSQPDCARGYILDGYPVDEDNFRHCKSLGLVPTDVIILEVSEELSVARQSRRSSRASDTNLDSARDRYKAYRKWMGTDPSIKFKTELDILAARTHVIQVDEHQTPNSVLSAAMSRLSPYHIMHTPNWTTLTPELKAFEFVVNADNVVDIALDLHSVFPDVPFLIELNEYGAITGYIPGTKQSDKIAKYSEIHAYIHGKQFAYCRTSLFKTIKESSQSASKLITTQEYPPINQTAAKLLKMRDDITELLIQITMKWNKPKLTDYDPEDILDSLEMLDACKISVASAITYPNTDRLKEQVTHITFRECDYDIPGFLKKSTFPDKIFKVLRNPPFRVDEISYSISQRLHLAAPE